MKWDIKAKGGRIVDTLLQNRGVEDRNEFFNPKSPLDLSLDTVGLTRGAVGRPLARIKKAKKDQELVVIFGDYDADGICATAILWEALHSLGIRVLPYIPDRFTEGYGLTEEAVRKLKERDPDLKLVITVDNGIVAHAAVDEAKRMGVEVIITDHHTADEKFPATDFVLHTTRICGAGLAWILARELENPGGLELAGIGTIADQLPLLGVNRSFAKYGLEALNKTVRPGLLALFEEAALEKGKLGTYDVNFVIAPRINAMGRLKHGLDSLRLLCTKNKERARDLALELGKTNSERQKVVDRVLAHARESLGDGVDLPEVIVLADESYHQGVVGLAAAKLVEEFNRPAIVFAKGKTHAKASARSIPGFDITAAVRQTEMLIEGGGHPLAAGFSVETSRLEEFTQRLIEISGPLLTPDILAKKLTIDCEINFQQIDWDLVSEIQKFAPFGVGNPTPIFVTRGVEVLDSRILGAEGKHLKLKLRKGKVFDALAFGGAERLQKVVAGQKVDVAYSLEVNEWNGAKSLQLRLRDIKYQHG